MKTVHLALPLLTGLLAACGSGSPAPAPATGTLHLEVTDAPFDWGQVEEAVVSIDQVRVHRQADGESGFVTLYEGAPVDCDLSDLRNGLTRGLGSGEVEVGTYRQVRLRFAAGRLRLSDGREFTTADDTLKFTSQDTSGMKVFLSPGVEVVEGEEVSVLLDFDLTRTFSPVPANDFDGARSFKLHPQIRAAVREATGELSGVVRAGSGSSFVADATLQLLPAGELDPTQGIATTFTEADGSAMFLGVPPGTYDLLVTQGGRTERVDSLTITAGATTSFDVTLP